MVGATLLRPANFISVRSSDGLPVAEPEMLRSPPIRVKAGTGNGFITAPTVWKLPP